MNDNYQSFGLVFGTIAFIGIWLYALSQWGLLIGLLAGWAPAVIGALIVFFLWPIALAVILALVVIGLYQSNYL